MKPLKPSEFQREGVSRYQAHYYLFHSYLLEPLAELEVVLEAGLDKLLNQNDLVHTLGFEGRLEQLCRDEKCGFAVR